MAGRVQEEVIVNGQLHAIIVRNTHDEQGIQFFTPNEFSSEKNLWLNALHKLFKRTMSHTQQANYYDWLFQRAKRNYPAFSG